MTLRHEDGDDDSQPPPTGRRDRRRTSLGGGDKRPGLERRRSRRASLGRSGHASPCSPASPQRAGFKPFNGHRAEDTSERYDIRRLRSGTCYRSSEGETVDRPVLSLFALGHCQVSFHPCEFKGSLKNGLGSTH